MAAKKTTLSKSDVNGNQHTALVDAMLAFVPPPTPRTTPGKPTLANDWEGFPRKDALFIERNPNALLFGVLMDRMMNANQAWLSACRLADRLGHFDVRRIATMELGTLAALLGRWQGQKSLHRFPPTTAKHLVAASQHLVKVYGGNASNIWSRDPGAKVVINRLLEFNGISDKLANMAVGILVKHYGVLLTGWENIDVAVDRHVARTFLRTGRVRGTPGQREYRVAEIRADVIAAARRLVPTFPGALDGPAFWVGQAWCNAGRAWCKDGQEPCPLSRVCPRDRRDWEIV